MGKINDTEIKVKSKSEFSSKSITYLFWKYTAFAFAGLALQSVAVLADGFFVGNGVGPIGLATVSVILPLMPFTKATFWDRLFNACGYETWKWGR